MCEVCMNLDVDIGNTRIKWRMGPAGEVQAAPVETWKDVLRRLPERVHGVRVCNVLGAEMERSFAAICQSRWQLVPQFARVVKQCHQLRISYDDPSKLGVDRWLAMLAATERCPGRDLMVVSAGTAVTVDLIDRQGAHAGGFIMPGLGTASRALFASAPRLPDKPVDVGADWQPGNTTEGCINAGFSALYQGLFIAILQRTPPTFSAVTAVFTGGDGPAMMRLCPTTISAFFQAGLVLDGLAPAMAP